MQKNYETYSAAQFLEDAFFIEWIKHQTPAAEGFWTAWMRSAPANLSAMQEAEVQLRAILSAQRIEVEETEAVEVWDRIQQVLQSDTGRGGEVGSHRVAKLRGMYRWVGVAAAVLVFLVFGFWFLVGRDKTGKPSVAVSPKVQQDIAPGREGAILTLADGRQIVLDSITNGTLTQEGAAGVSKQGNQLVYDQQGKVAEVVYNTMSTPKGRQYSLVLSDGSKVWLNAASSIRFPTAFAGDTRGVEITGEAYFEVAHNPSKPFIVLVNDMKVEVLGTHFNINAYADEPVVKTTLLEGSVKATAGSGHSVILKPGQQAAIGHLQVTIKDKVDVEQVVAWKNGKFQFGEGMDIGAIMRQISRWYNIEVEYKGSVAGQIGGTISREVNLSEVLHMLELTGVVNFELNGKKVVVLPNKP